MRPTAFHVKSSRPEVVALLKGFEKCGLDTVERSRADPFGGLPLTLAMSHDSGVRPARVTLLGPPDGGSVWAGAHRDL